MVQANIVLHTMERLRHALPEGYALPEAVWRRRHRGFLVFLLCHAVSLTIISLVTGHTTLFSLGVGSWIALFALLGAIPYWSRKVRASWVSLGLVTSSALLVHLSGGYIEMHFHYFVIVTFLALYQDWTPFLLAVGYVVLQHGLGGYFFPHMVYNHPDAWSNPWKWAFIHAGFLSSACIGVIIAWRANESNRARIENLLNSSSEGFLGVDLQGRIIFANPAIEVLTGHSVSALIERPIDDLLVELVEPGTSGFPQSSSNIRRSLAAPDETYEGEAIFRRQDGRQLIVEYGTSPLKDRTELSGIVLTLTDITKRKRAEEALKASEERFRSFAQSAVDAIISADHEGSILSWNKGAEVVFGYAEAEVLGQRLTLLMPERYREAHARGLERMRAGGAPRVIGKTVELHGLRKDGAEFPMELSLSTWKTGDVTFYGGIIRDASERKRAEEALRSSEEQLRQSQKMEAIGRLAGGVAHDFNNLLLVITGYSDLALSRLEAPQLQNEIEQIKKAANRAASLTRQLLAFSRRQMLVPKELDLNGVITDMHKMLHRLIGEDINIVTLPGSSLGQVKADAGQIEQVILNLVVNARDAMPKGGRLIIETANVELDEAYSRGHVDVRPGPYVMLAVSDNGSGMDAATKARLFEPFFTTKEQGKGTGLGLATVYGIVKQSGGNIWVYSEPGKGTTFKVYLPQVQHVDQTVESAPITPPASHGFETILLVEDEENVRTLVAGILESRGYAVLKAQNGAEALRIFREQGDAIQLMITDVVMPQMGGAELAGHLATLRPQLKLLYMSGYTDDAIVHHGVLEAGKAFLQKPFTPEALARKVREVLDGPVMPTA